MTLITKTETTYSISWDNLISWDFQQEKWLTSGRYDLSQAETSNLKEAIEAFEKIAADNKNQGNMMLHVTTNYFFYDSEDQKWVFDKGETETVKRLKLLGESKANINNTGAA